MVGQLHLLQLGIELWLDGVVIPIPSHQSTEAHVAYTFDKVSKVGKWEVLIDSAAQYGYFEHDIYGEGGGLWFEHNELQDYDGVYSLPAKVIEAIRAAGFIVPVDMQ